MPGRDIAYIAGFVIIGYLLLCLVWTVTTPSTDAEPTPHAKKKDAHPPKKGHEADPHAKKTEKAGHEESNFMAWARDGAIWTVIVFLGLLAVLRVMAWQPWQKLASDRETAIQQAVEEAKLAREETARQRAEFEAMMKAAFAEIPKLREEAQRDGDALREELLKKAHKEIDDERRRLRREIETARDQALSEIWNHTAQLATLISTKTIAQSLTEDDHRRLTEDALSDVKDAGSQWKTELGRFGQ